MAESDDAKLDELKRLLRRLDKALPPPSLPPETADVSPVQQSSLVEGGQPRVIAAERRANGTALRTVILAGGVSMVVSLGVAAFVAYEILPIKRLAAPEATSKAEPHRDAEQMNGLLSAGTPGISPKAPSEEKQQPAKISETAALQAERTPRSGLEPATIRKPPSEAAAVASLPAPTVAEGQTANPLQTEPARPAEATPAAVPDASKGGASATSAPPAVRADEPQATAPRGDAADHPLAELDAAQFLRRGLIMLSSGSVSAAQLLLERAADLGSGDAAFALATTYDGAPGAPRQGPAVRPDADLALRWYARAQELGVAEARKRLGELKDGAATQTGGDVR